jgi:hypothetical protein
VQGVQVLTLQVLWLQQLHVQKIARSSQSDGRRPGKASRGAALQDVAHNLVARRELHSYSHLGRIRAQPIVAQAIEFNVYNTHIEVLKIFIKMIQSVEIEKVWRGFIVNRTSC